MSFPAPSGTQPAFRPPPVSSAAPDATSTADPGGGGGGGGGGGPSSSLYLYTFLVTLGLLLTITVTIVTRSFLIRRRIQRAILNGTYVFPNDPASGASQHLEKPKLWEVYVDAATADKGAPLSAAILNRPAHDPTPTKPEPPRASRFLQLPFRRPAPSPPPPAAAETPPASSENLPKEDIVQMALLIAMPAQQHTHAAEGELPLLELGVRTASARL